MHVFGFPESTKTLDEELSANAQSAKSLGDGLSGFPKVQNLWTTGFRVSRKYKIFGRRAFGIPESRSSTDNMALSIHNNTFLFLNECMQLTAWLYIINDLALSLVIHPKNQFYQSLKVDLDICLLQSIGVEEYNSKCLFPEIV